LFLVAGHIGTVVTPPRFFSPTFDGGAVATADQSFAISWDDGDVDPTARYFFYFLDHGPTSAVTATTLQMIATPIIDGGVWASCDDAGVRDCRNEIVWDTHALDAGSYWVVAINHDPPYLVDTLADGPVRVAHPAPLPPAVVVLRPDGVGAADTTYQAAWFATGALPLQFHLESSLAPNGAWQAVADVADARSWSWDTSGLPDGPYYLRVTIADATGLSAFSDARYPLVVFHAPPDAGSPVDAGNPTDAGALMDAGTSPAPHAKGCGCSEAGCVPLLALGLVRLTRRRRF
jgi:hypothetical protein